ncbi:MAG TPA: hypothetical protein VKA84_03405 [Gemmatimonadaceae bacterium]|nr:hypothetical protein [Gemmatimonadaceae bacterium]
MSAGLRVGGAAIVYRLFDVGYEIALERALDLLATSAPERVRPVRGEAQAIQIPNPPVTAILGGETVVIDGRRIDVEVSARVFDFGVVSLRAHVPAPGEMSWEEWVAFGNAVDAAHAVDALFAQHLRVLAERIRPAVARPNVAPVTEDYVVYRVRSLRRSDGGEEEAADELLRDVDVAPLLLNEWRPLSEGARRELLPHRFSYYADDLAILTWDNALIVDPTGSDGADSDVQFMLEFANAQLLELRYYDAVLDAELPKMYDRVEAARAGGTRGLLTRRFAPLLGDLQRLVADSTELVERVENSLKVTDDVYLARIYSTALEIFRGRAWRNGIDRKLGIIRETYAMLNAESQAARAEVMELAIILLIVAELVVGLAK